MSQRTIVLPPPVLAPVRRRRRPGNESAATPRLSVVIVNHCQWENTAALVRQILRTTPGRSGAVEVVVVDNHSPRHPVAARLRRWPGVSVRRWGRNRGFARAVNEGCRLSRGQWFLLLNPDLTITEGFLEGVLAVADQLSANDENAGIVGFQLLNGDGTKQLSAGAFPTLPGTITGLLRSRSRRKYRSLPGDQRCQVPWVSGCCLLLRRQCAQAVGNLDESFFLYYEDVDLCRRARAAGWSVWYEPAYRAVHHDPLHCRAVPPLVRLITRHSLLTYALCHWASWEFTVLTHIVRLEARVRRLFAVVRSDKQGAGIFKAMGRMARDLSQGQRAKARRRLGRAIEKVVGSRFDLRVLPKKGS
jgi:N-acetylglucosaminyl-diphospho-decaprenol L-rhamnosyltransferase